MGGRREVSVISHRPVTSSDLKHERLFFRGSVSTFLQLVVPTFLEWIEPNFLSHGATLQHARPTDGLTPDSVSPPQSLYGRRSVVLFRHNLIFLRWIDYQIFSEMCELLVCIVPVRPLLSSMAYVYHVNG